jgi:hypothetical protein
LTDDDLKNKAVFDRKKVDLVPYGVFSDDGTKEKEEKHT